MIIAFKAPSPLTGLKDLPSRILIGKWGRNETGKGGGFTVNERTAEILPRVQHALSYDRVALDFEHNTVPTLDADGKEVPPTEPQKIAATGIPEVVRGEGLFLRDLKWTPEGGEHALGGHYPDLSPAVKLNEAGEVLFLHSAGLCRQGSVLDLQLFSAALDAGQLAKFSALTAFAARDTSVKGEAGDDTGAAVRADFKRLLDAGMTQLELADLLDRSPTTIASIIDGTIANPPAELLRAVRAIATPKPKKETFSAATSPTVSTTKNMDHKKLLLLLLGLPETATDSDIETGAKAFAAKLGNVGEVTAFAAGLKTLTENVGALTSRLEKADKDAVLAEAIRQGKVVPHTAAKLSLADFTALVAELPANVVPLAQRTIEGVKTFSASVTQQGVGDASADAEVARQMGNTPEAVAKFGNKSR